MTVPEVVRTPDGHFRRVIYSLGPYIADYPEQCLLACVVQGWCSRYVTSHSRNICTDSLTLGVRDGPRTSTSVESAAHKHSTVHLRMRWTQAPYGINMGLLQT